MKDNTRRAALRVFDKLIYWVALDSNLKRPVGQAVQRLKPEEREALTHLKSEDTQKYRLYYNHVV
jgi:hypothetical protein